LSYAPVFVEPSRNIMPRHGDAEQREHPTAAVLELVAKLDKVLRSGQTRVGSLVPRSAWRRVGRENTEFDDAPGFCPVPMRRIR